MYIDLFCIGQVGSLCMDIVEGELQRAEQLREQLSRRGPKEGEEKGRDKYQTVIDKQDQVGRLYLERNVYHVDYSLYASNLYFILKF